jgi:hypothetical protein
MTLRKSLVVKGANVLHSGLAESDTVCLSDVPYRDVAKK